MFKKQKHRLVHSKSFLKFDLDLPMAKILQIDTNIYI